jgi:hypothetical protein
MHAKFWLANLKGSVHLEDLKHGKEDNIKMNLRKIEVKGC